MIIDRYYYMQLSKEEKSIYIKLYNGAVNLEKEILPGGIFPEPETINREFTAVAADNPFLYYFNQSVLSVKQSGFGTSLVPQYFCTRQQIDTYNARIEKIVNKIMSDLHLSEASEAEKVRRIHDYFCRNISYDKEAVNGGRFNRLVASHSIIGVFAKQKAVCEGISKAFKLVLNTAGIKCIVVSGLGGSEKAPHSWNIVKIDGKPYHIDVTWDLANTKGNYINFNYYNLTDDDICRDHFDFHNMPICNYSNENYFVKNRLEFYKQSQIFRYIQKSLKKRKTDFYFRYRGNESIEEILQGTIQFASQILPQYGIQGKINGTFRKAQKTGRITVAITDTSVL